MKRFWTKYNSPKQGSLDFTNLFEPKITVVVYVYCTIEVPEDMSMSGLLRSNDGAMVWLKDVEIRYHKRMYYIQ